MTRRQVAAAFGVHMQTVTKWEQEGLPRASHGGRGRASFYDESAVRSWLSVREANAAGPAGSLNPMQERAKRDRTQAMIAMQMYQRRLGKLVDREDVELAGQAYTKAWRAQILAWPKRAVLSGAIRPEQEAGVAALCRELLSEIGAWHVLSQLEAAGTDVA
jgi:phage terminase Nu1 subunit (DNA packaging protein)